MIETVLADMSNSHVYKCNPRRHRIYHVPISSLEDWQSSGSEGTIIVNDLTARRNLSASAPQIPIGRHDLTLCGGRSASKRVVRCVENKEGPRRRVTVPKSFGDFSVAIDRKHSSAR